MKKIVLDTNFLMIPFYFRVDIFSELQRICNFRYELYIISKTVAELESIAEKQQGKSRDAAKFALKLVKQKSLKRIGKTQDSRTVDDIIQELDREGLLVATQDRDLKKRLRQNKIPVVILRQKKYLEIIGM